MTIGKLILKCGLGTSLVVKWLRIHLPVQGTWVPSLVSEDPTCLCILTTENHALEPGSHKRNLYAATRN